MKINTKAGKFLLYIATSPVVQVLFGNVLYDSGLLRSGVILGTALLALEAYLFKFYACHRELPVYRVLSAFKPAVPRVTQLHVKI